MDLRTHSQLRIGAIWTKTDHEFLSRQLEQVDKLAQAMHNARVVVEEACTKCQPNKLAR